ncbi:AAA family ATPase [Aequorivita todarodis]|uniref:ParA family protein n=1 Tax=Flavobacteriaceae TaxID=49546 RepID=UPI0023509AFA|nr:AAA family ATPase [Aequorivita todarodis]MDC8001390.1 AAA family ATPase [Aequorivita todarodis]
MTKKICLFNHKGGVSKTTTTYNLGWKLAREGKKVILVDADPQCNLTGLILGDDFDDFYVDHPNENIKSGIAPAFDATPVPLSAIDCYQIPENNNLLLVPGHIGLSEYEVPLSIAHQLSNTIPTLKNLPGALNSFLDLLAQKYSADYILIDMNPSLSSINQNLFCLSDYFLVPTSPDYFSVMAIKSLTNVLPKWEQWAKMARITFKDSSYPFPDKTTKFLGTIVQNFTIRNGEPSSAFKKWIDEVSNTVTNTLVPTINAEGMLLDPAKYINGQVAKGYCLAEIPNFSGLIPRSQRGRLPVYELTDAQLGTGTVLEQYQQIRERFLNIFSELAVNVENMTN